MSDYQKPCGYPVMDCALGVYVTKRENRIEELEAENEKLRKGFEIYERERNRFKHATPEMSGAYFLSGGHGPKDDNQMPQFVEIVPCIWMWLVDDL